MYVSRSHQIIRYITAVLDLEKTFHDVLTLCKICICFQKSVWTSNLQLVGFQIREVLYDGGAGAK